MATALRTRTSRLKFVLTLGAGLVIGTALAGATRAETVSVVVVR